MSDLEQPKEGAAAKRSSKAAAKQEEKAEVSVKKQESKNYETG